MVTFDQRAKGILTVAAVVVAVAVTGLLVTLALQALVGVSTRGFFYLGVMLATWMAGPWAGALTALLATVFIDYFLLEPLHVWTFWEPRSAVDLGMFLLTALLIMVLTRQLNDSKKDALQAREALAQELEGRVRRWSSAAHDLKQPLAALLLRIDVLRQKSDFHDGKAMRDLDDMERAVGEVRALAGEMEDAAKLAAGHKVDLDLAPADLVRLVQEAVEDVMGSSERTIRLTATDSEVLGEWDAPRLQRVIRNLLSNAVKYSPYTTQIDVTVRRDGEDWVELQVSDRGVGIPESELDLVFERFYRGSNVRQRVTGTGLGLAGSRALVELHGGELTVMSHEGAGSTFFMRLPTSDPLQHPPAATLG